MKKLLIVLLFLCAPCFAQQGTALQACSSAATTTADTVIVPALGGTGRVYITGYVCTNNSAVASLLSFKDGATVKWTEFIPANTGSPAARHTFAQSIRGSINTAFQFAVATNATSTICCVEYYSTYY